MKNNRIEEQIEEISAKLTLDEKLTMIHGAGFFKTGSVDRLGIPSIYPSDGPMGVRAEFENAAWRNCGTTEDYVTYLPSNSALASTWNPELAYETGQVLGEETRGRGKDVILAPGINIKRSPLCGRNFEYMSEDPYLIKELTVPLIKGIQENDVASCVKHFAANSQETNRLMVDTIVDERTLQEMYLPGFKAAVQEADAYSIMGAYNKLNGKHCCENKDLLQRILIDEWGFDGTVISDWGGVHLTKEAAEAPLDIEMSVTPDFDEYKLANPLKKAIESGELSEELVDKKVKNILRMMLRLKMIGEDKDSRKAGTYNSPMHRQSVYETAKESIILLKNEDHRLPLQKEKLKKLAVIGKNGARIHSNGGGSAEIKALYEISPLMGLHTRLGGNTQIVYAEGYYVEDKDLSAGANWQENSLREETLAERLERERRETEARLQAGKEKHQQLMAEAIALAKECEEVIFVGGLDHDFDIEGQDRRDMKLPYGQDELIEELLKVNPNTVIVMMGGSPVEMPWRNQANAIVWCYYAGMEGGNALADVLLGNVNPSGKLAESFPVSYADTVTGVNGEFAKDEKVVYKEGIFVGYRYFEKENKKPAFSFGHGLSYTTFGYSDLQISTPTSTAQGAERSADTRVTVSFTLENTGKVAGAEIAQVYVSEVKPVVERPVKELKGFKKVFLQPGEKTTVTVTLDESAFAYFDVDQKRFVANKGMYRIFVGSSSDQMLLEQAIEL